VKEELKTNYKKTGSGVRLLPLATMILLKDIHRRLKDKKIVGKMVNCGSMTALKESHSSYNTLFDGKKATFSLQRSGKIRLTFTNYLIILYLNFSSDCVHLRQSVVGRIIGKYSFVFFINTNRRR